MLKREFLKTTAILAAAATLMPDTLLASPADFSLPSLPYPAGALEPFIDKQTMELHHGKHHAGYVQKLIDALKGKPELTWTMDRLMDEMKGQPEAVRNNGGGHYNHSLFWQIMRPAKESNGPVGKLADRINATFGSLDAFKTRFKETAMSRFGSGWAWLVFDPKNGLSLASTPNQDNTLMNLNGTAWGYPIIGLDVWEHAYYLKYQNRRAEYVDAFWNLVNWDEAEKRYQSMFLKK